MSRAGTAARPGRPAGSAPGGFAARVLLVSPIPLLVTTFVAFNGFVALFGFRLGYLLGFLFTWLFWCALVPLWVLGPRGLADLFRPTRPRVGRPAWLGWTLLALPLLLAYGYAFPLALPHATPAILMLSAALAIVNGTLEEVFWRGAFVRVFPGDPLRAWAWPSIGFGLWHLAPLSVAQGMGNPGGAASFVGVAAALGLCWGWVAYRTGSIRWPVISHVLLDFAGLGALVYVR